MVADKCGIKINVIKVITEFAKKIKGTDVGNKSIGYLKALINDAEFDVRYFAEMGLKEFN